MVLVVRENRDGCARWPGLLPATGAMCARDPILTDLRFAESTARAGRRLPSGNLTAQQAVNSPAIVHSHYEGVGHESRGKTTVRCEALEVREHVIQLPATR